MYTPHGHNDLNQSFNQTYHSVAENQGLLNQSYQGSPHSGGMGHGQSPMGHSPMGGNPHAEQFTANLAGGGQKVEDAMARFGVGVQLIFFISALGIIFGAVIGGLGSLVSFEPANLVDEVFLGLFGLILAILDFPGRPSWTQKYVHRVKRYWRFLTHLSGKSLWLLFLGCMTAVSLWPSNRLTPGTSTSELLVFIAVIIALVVITTGIIGFLISVAKSRRLEHVRSAIRNVYRQNIGDSLGVFRKFATSEPQNGLKMDEFNRMSNEFTQGRTKFNAADLFLIYNALEDEIKDHLHEREFLNWMTGPMTFV